VEFKQSDRLRTRLFAIDLRLAELDDELRRTQLQVHQLQSRLEDAKMARLMGEEAGDPAELGPELERSRARLEGQAQFIAEVKKRQRSARGDVVMQLVKERHEANRRPQAGETAEAE